MKSAADPIIIGRRAESHRRAWSGAPQRRGDTRRESQPINHHITVKPGRASTPRRTPGPRMRSSPSSRITPTSPLPPNAESSEAQLLKSCPKSVSLNAPALPPKESNAGRKYQVPRLGSKRSSDDVVNDDKASESSGAGGQGRKPSLRSRLRRTYKAFKRNPLAVEVALLSVESTCATYIVIEVPYEMAFNEKDGLDPFYVIGYVVDVIACICVWLRIKEARRNRPKEINLNSRLDKLSVRCQAMPLYLRLLVTLPVDLFLWFHPTWYHFVHYYRWIHLVPVPGILSRFFGGLDRAPHVPFTVARLVRGLVCLLTVVHVLGCALYYFSHKDYSDTYLTGWWREENDNEHSNHYLRMLYFSMLALSTVNTEFVVVDRNGGGHDWEYFFGILVIIGTNVIVLYISANLTAITMRTFQKLDAFRSRLALVDGYLQRNKVSRQLRKLVVMHFQRGFKLNHASDEEMLKQLPPGLARDVMREKNSRTLRRTPILLGCQPAALGLLATLMHQVTYMKGETIVKQGEVVLELLILETGEYKEYHQLKDEDSDDEVQGSSVEDLRSGDETVSSAAAAGRASQSVAGVPRVALVARSKSRKPFNGPKSARPKCSSGAVASDTMSIPDSESTFDLSSRRSGHLGHAADAKAAGYIRTIALPGTPLSDVGFFFNLRQRNSIVATTLTSCLVINHIDIQRFENEFARDAVEVRAKVLEQAKLRGEDDLSDLGISTRGEATDQTKQTEKKLATQFSRSPVVPFSTSGVLAEGSASIDALNAKVEQMRQEGVEASAAHTSELARVNRSLEAVMLQLDEMQKQNERLMSELGAALA